MRESGCLLISMVWFVSAALVPGTATAGIVARWHFDEASGATVNDTGGSSDGTLSNTGATFVGGGISGNAIRLDRTQNGFVTMGDVLGFPSGDFSTVVWVNTTASDAVAVLAKHEAFSENGYFFAIGTTGGGGAADKATFVVSEFVNQAGTSATSVNDGTWHQIAGVYRAAGNKTLYVDANPEAIDASEPMVTNGAPFLIGGINVSGVATGSFTGLVDEVQVYDRALTAQEVGFLYDNPTRAIPEPAGAIFAALAALAAMRAIREPRS